MYKMSCDAQITFHMHHLGPDVSCQADVWLSLEFFSHQLSHLLFLVVQQRCKFGFTRDFVQRADRLHQSSESTLFDGIQRKSILRYHVHNGARNTFKFFAAG